MDILAPLFSAASTALITLVLWFIKELYKDVKLLNSGLASKVDRIECESWRNQGGCLNLLLLEARKQTNHIKSISEQFASNNDLDMMIENQVKNVLRKNRQQKG